MNVSLSPELESFIMRKLQSGRYVSASEVVREALRWMERQDQERASEIAAFLKEDEE